MSTITLEQAKNLQRGTTIYSINQHNTDGTLKRWRVNGKVKTWVRRPLRVQVPLKRGLRSYDYLTENNLYLFSLEKTGR